MAIGIDLLVILSIITLSSITFAIAIFNVRKNYEKRRMQIVSKLLAKQDSSQKTKHSRSVKHLSIARKQISYFIASFIIIASTTFSTGCDQNYVLAVEEIKSSDLNVWLTNNPRVSNAIYWNGTYAEWNQNQKEELLKAVTDNREGYHIHWETPPENQQDLNDSASPVTLLSNDDAWKIYISTIANMLALELSKELPWTVTNLEDEAIKTLFDSRTIFTKVDNGYKLIHRSLPASPHEIMNFLDRENIIGHSRLETILRLIDWSHHNHSHFSGRYETLNIESYYDYRGAPPASAVIHGSEDKHNRFSHWTAGCRGTTAFFQTILRTINIPVIQEIQCGHALPYFISEGLYLSHGDDPYNGLWSDEEYIPVEALLISKDTHYHWFGQENTEEQKCNNVGRQTCEIAKGRISEAIQQSYCIDENNNDKEYKKLTKALSRCANQKEILNDSFLNRIKEKVSERGGCTVR